MPNFRIVMMLMLVTAFLSACSNSIPTIDQVISTQIISFNSKDQTILHNFSVFCAIHNKDGVQDIDQMYILNDADQLLWFLSGNNFQTISNENRIWLGSKNLSPAPREAMPVGKIRIIAYSRAGDKAVAESGLPLINENLADLIPKARREGGNLVIAPAFKKDSMDREVVIKDWSGVEIKRFRIFADQIGLTDLLAGRPADTTNIYINDYLYNGSVLVNSGPW